MSRRRFIARADGKVLVDIRQPMLLTPEETRALIAEASRAARDAEHHRVHADGTASWTAQPLHPIHGSSAVLISHRGTTRVFRQTTVRRSYGCNACEGRIGVGEIAYVEAQHKQSAKPNWRNVRLCEACVHPELRGRAILNRIQKLSGVGVQR